MRKRGQRLLTLALAAALSLAGCGAEGERQADGYVYVPEFIDLTGGEGSQNMDDLVLQGDDLYYSAYYYDEDSMEGGYRFYRRNCQTGETTELDLEMRIEGADYSYPRGLYFDQDGNLCSLVSGSIVDEDGNYNQVYSLMKFDAECRKLLDRDISEAMNLKDGGSGHYIQEATMDDTGRLFAVMSTEQNAYILAFDADGELLAQIDSGSDWVNSIGAVGDKVLVTRYGDMGMECVEVDLDNKSMGAAHSGMPSSYNSNSLSPAPDGGLLINDGSKLWKYDMETETTEEILTWTDCDINGSYVQMVQTLEDGRIAALSQNWSNDTQELAYLTRTKASQAMEKQVITLATLYSSQDLQEKVVSFNKQSDAYKVRIIAYRDEMGEDMTYQDVITALNNSITSANCPDIIDLSYGNVSSYVSKGLLVDLAPYLENSSVRREDLVETVLDAYTFGDTLVCLPTGFTISTVMGRTSQLGDRTSWSIKDIMEFAAQYPDAKLFYYSSKDRMLETCLQYSSDAFIDYDAGKCDFDSEEFLDILEFCNTLETETQWDREGESFPKQISEGKILLNDVSLREMTEMQMYSLMFNEPVTFIGYPTADGSSGNRLNGENCFGITSKCKDPDGAWAFIESMLQYEPQPEWAGMNRFSVRRDMLEESFEKAMEENGTYDEDGNIMLDDDGEPMIWPKTTWSYDDWSAEIYAAAPEQVQVVKDLIASATAATSNDQTVLSIIQEEAQGYFEGQKTAQEVAGIIQSRVQTYISENS